MKEKYTMNLNIDDLLAFIYYARLNKIKLTKRDLFAVCFTKSFSEIKLFLRTLEECGVKIGVTSYEHIIPLIDNIEDCRSVLNYLIEISTKDKTALNSCYRQLVLLSNSQGDVNKIFEETKELGLQLNEVWREKWKDKASLNSGFVDVRTMYLHHHVEDFIQKYQEYYNQVLNFDIPNLKSKIANMDADTKHSPKIIKSYLRNKYVKQFAREVSMGNCQLCESRAPFEDSFGTPFLEVHHIEWLSRGGKDDIENVIALCPNCHRKMHIVDQEEDVTKLKRRAIELALVE
ncbi:HNH endonuclease [Priestia megaterium]|uniref:HNH endonuclease n=1 Tax=Priestia megaterium TaxID=1404 RepID=UPI001D009C6E|nr:HNH endonuclease signature motif containing protein [Priestia megaterium]